MPSPPNFALSLPRSAREATGKKAQRNMLMSHRVVSEHAHFLWNWACNGCSFKISSLSVVVRIVRRGRFRTLVPPTFAWRDFRAQKKSARASKNGRQKVRDIHFARRPCSVRSSGTLHKATNHILLQMKAIAAKNIIENGKQVAAPFFEIPVPRATN